MNVLNSRTYSKDIAISEARAIGFHATAAALTEMLRAHEKEFEQTL